MVINNYYLVITEANFGNPRLFTSVEEAGEYCQGLHVFHEIIPVSFEGKRIYLVTKDVMFGSPCFFLTYKEAIDYVNNQTIQTQLSVITP